MAEENIKTLSKQLRDAVKEQSWARVRQTQIGAELLDAMEAIIVNIEENASLYQFGRKSLSKLDGDIMNLDHGDDELTHALFDESDDSSPVVWDEYPGTYIEDSGNINFDTEWIKLGKVVLKFLKELGRWMNRK